MFCNLHQSRLDVANFYFLKQNMHQHSNWPNNRGRINCIYPSDRHVVLARKERLLADHLVNDPDALAKKKSMSLRSSYCSVCFAMRKERTKAALEEDLAEKEILVTNLSLWLSHVQSSSNPENRLRLARSWLETKFLQCRIMTS